MALDEALQLWRHVAPFEGHSRMRVWIGIYCRAGIDEARHDHDLRLPQKIMRCAPSACAACWSTAAISSHCVRISADFWPDHLRLSDIEDRFVCRVCGRRGADVRRPDFPQAPMGTG